MRSAEAAGRRRRAAALAALVAVAVVLPGGGAARAQDCKPGIVDLRDSAGTARISVEVVDTPEGREKGLMFRQQMPRYSGMLFVYEYPQPTAFWMKNTLIPLDMLFFDDAGRLTRIHENARPGDLTPIPGGDAVRYVLELNAGMARTLHLEPGAELRHPAVDQAAAAWPCPAS